MSTAVKSNVTDLQDAVAHAKQADIPGAIKFLTTDDIMAQAEAEAVIEGECYRGCVTQYYGDSGIGKSYLVMTRAANLSLKGGRAIYVATEGIYAYKGRMEAWRKHNKQTADRTLWYTQPVDLFDAESATRFKMAAKQVKPDLIVFDVFSDCIGDASENDSSNMKTVTGHMKEIAQWCNCAVAFVHHTVKGGNGYRGSSILKNNTDATIEIAKSGDGLMMICEKIKHIEQWNPKRYDFIKIELENGKTNQVPLRATEVVQEQSVIDSRIELVLKALRDSPDGLKFGQIKKRVSLGDSTLKNEVIPTLKERGWISNSGRNTPYILTEIGRKKAHENG